MGEATNNWTAKKHRADALRAGNNFHDAKPLYEELLAAKPRHPEILESLAAACLGLGFLDQAARHYEKLIAVAPKNLTAHFNNARIAEMRGDLDTAVRAYEKCIRLNASHAVLYYNLGAILQRQGHYDEAIARYNKAAQLNPGIPEIHNNFGSIYTAQGRLDDAIASFQNALKIRPDFHEAKVNLGVALVSSGRIADGIAQYEAVLQNNPDNPLPLAHLGTACSLQGKQEQALHWYRKALRSQKCSAATHSDMLLLLNYLPKLSNAELFAEHKSWWARHGAPIAQYVQHENDRSLDRALRVGYVSRDLCSHSVAAFMEPILSNHDDRVVSTYCYSDVLLADGTTSRLKAVCQHWRDVDSKSHDQLAEQIREDRIDILVDLAGHTANNRLLMFAKRPAPIQLSYLGYPNTTGMATMDYRITDAIADPPEYADFHSETLIRLPHGFLCYQAPDLAPPIGELPSRHNGYVTFGSFNNIAKVTPHVISVWADLLKATPGSKLLLKFRALGDPPTRQYLVDAFSRYGIPQERLEMLGLRNTTHDHLSTYHQVDIALDTFPYNGTTTTCEALYMGVPVITWLGRRHAGRVSASILRTIGHAELIAKDEDEYIQKAAALAGDIAALTTLRGSLRTDLLESGLCNGPLFTRELEKAYRSLWRIWVSGTASTP